MLEQGMVQRRQGAGSVVVSTRPQARYVHTLSSLSDLFQFALVTTCDMVPGHRVIVGPSHRMALLLSSEPLSLLSINQVTLDAKIAADVGAMAGERWHLVEGLRRHEKGGKPFCYLHFPRSACEWSG